MAAEPNMPHSEEHAPRERKNLRPPRIAVLMPIHYAYCRDIVRGVRAYQPVRGSWRLDVGTMPEDLERWLRRIAAHEAFAAGIVMLSTPELQETAVNSPVPIVNISGRPPEIKVPSVLPDNARIGRLAAEHLLERGFRNFLFLGDPNSRYAAQRGEGFRDRIEAAGHTCGVFFQGGMKDELVLRRTPRPVGIFCQNDERANRVLGTCETVGVRVPEDAGVIGVDNDDLLCDVAAVPLTSVNPAAERIGFQAAGLLDRLLRGEAPPAQIIRMPPGGVVARRSTDSLALDDPELIRAVQFIRDHACDPITVDEIVAAVSISRRTLETRFKQQFERTLHQEIRRVQLERAKQLLTETNLPVPDVARRCGFRYPTRFTDTFSKTFGRPPSEYRQCFTRVRLAEVEM